MQCDRCGERLIEIDRRGERLTGCVECNCWKEVSERFIVELSMEDFERLEDVGGNSDAGGKPTGCGQVTSLPWRIIISKA